MISSILLALNVVFPLVFLLGIGVVAKKVGWASKKSLGEINRVVFKILLPIQLFLNVYDINTAKLWELENIYIILLVVGILSVILWASMMVCARMGMDQKKKVIIVQAIYRSNLALFGVPVSAAIYGGEPPIITSLMIMIVVPLYNISSAILLGTASHEKVSKAEMLKRVFTNPLVLGTTIGIIVSICRISLPSIIVSALEGASKAATPVAFIVLGGSLEFTSIKKNRRSILAVSAMRLVVVPIIIIGVAVALGFRGAALAILLGTAASPVAVSTFSMAKELDIEPDLAGEQVVVTTLFSTLTMFLWIAVLDFYHFL